MEVVSLSPLRTGKVRWQPRPSAHVLTVICKATYLLLPGESALSDSQEPLWEEESHGGEGAPAGADHPSDLAPRKARADVILVGHAHAPRGELVRSFVARLVIGQIDKEIEIFGERCFSREGHLRDGGRIARMPLRHERAAGGPGTDNPLGVPTGPSARPDPLGQVFLPNLQAPGTTPADRSEVMAPIGFGPVPRYFPARQARLGSLPARFEEQLAETPLPEGFDLGYFNAAPADQQLPALRENERLILQNLSREHPRLLTSLPGMRPRAFVERPGAPPRELGMKADTLWIDADRGLCTMTFRGQVSLQEPDERGRVLVALEQPGERVTAEEALRMAGPLTQRMPSIPPQAELRTMALPQVPPADRAPARRAMVQTAAVPFEIPPKHNVPAWLPPSPGVSAGPAPAPSAPPPFVAPPPLMGRPIVPVEPLPPRSIESAPPPSPPGRLPAGFGLMAASNAAADAALGREARGAQVEPPAPAARPRREAVELLWVDPLAARAIRAAFPDLLASIKAPAKAAEREEAKRLELERIEAEACRALVAAPRAEATALAAKMAAAAGDDGRFRPPLVVVAGELRVAFDPIEALRAMVGAASSIAAPGTPLAGAVDRAAQLLGSPFAAAAPGAAERLGQALREAFSQEKHAMPQGWLDEQVERALIEQRRHQKRIVLGEPKIRALLATPGSSIPLPCYLPEALGARLPMLPSFPARVLGEARPPEDPWERASICLQVKALGRALSFD
ncbi:MAG: DUF2169 domain-containing protein [Byssovorax sp.]